MIRGLAFLCISHRVYAYLNYGGFYFTKKIGFKLMLILSLALSILNLTAFAYNTGDDYPEKYKNAAKDSLVDEWNFYNRECTSFTAWCLNSEMEYILQTNMVVLQDGEMQCIGELLHRDWE